MHSKLPEKLVKAPLLETVFEIRFRPSKQSASELLLGLLYSKLPEYQELQRLPVADVPRQIRDSDPNLQYAASHGLSSDTRHILVGDRVVAFSQTAPYVSWTDFQQRIVKVIAAVRETNLIEKTERYSLKAINLIEAEEGSQLSVLNGRFEIAGRTATDRGFHFRSEFLDDNVLTILEITGGAKLSVRSETKSGLLIQLDSIRTNETEGIWDEPQLRVDQLHVILKQLFFNTLTAETINRFEPVW